jgi:high-affinity iron transporter
LLSDGSLVGKLLHTLIGYTERPTELQLIIYIATLLAMFVLMRLARPAPRERVPAAAE